jgi:hypothetical protein
LLNVVFDAFVEIANELKAVTDSESGNLIKSGKEAFVQRASRKLPVPPDRSKRNEMTAPKRWENQKETISDIVIALWSQ